MFLRGPIKGINRVTEHLRVPGSVEEGLVFIRFLILRMVMLSGCLFGGNARAMIKMEARKGTLTQPTLLKMIKTFI
jgi:hypothetical protein